MPMLAKTALILAGCYLLLVAAVFIWQRNLIYLPITGLTHTPSEVGLAYVDLELPVADRVIHGWWVPHDQPRGTLFFCHGNAGNIGHRLQSLKMFHAMGLNICIFDYAGYGKSTGKPTQEALRRDVHAVWDWLVDEQGADPATVVLFGRSLGGGVVALLTADLLKQGVVPAGLVMESTFSSMAAVAARRYPWLPVGFLLKDDYRASAALAASPIPLLSIHSREDEIIPFKLGERLYQDYPGPKRRLIIQGDHNNGFLLSRDTYEAGWRAFLGSVLAESGGKDLPDGIPTDWNNGKYLH